MAEKMTYKQIVHKIIYDAGYAQQIAELVRRAKGSGKDAEDARRDLESRFEPREDELADLGLTKDALKTLSCAANPQVFRTNDTSFMLLDFSRMC